MKRLNVRSHFLIACLFLFASTSVHASPLIPEKIVLQADEQLGIIYTHQLQKNQTVYGLSKFFNTELSQIAVANPGIELTNIKINQTVNIPINTSMISSERNLSPSKNYIPVLYTVKAKDNLFRIAKVYFNQSIENVMHINKLEDMNLSVGQKLLVGWYEYNPVYKDKLAWSQKGIEVNASQEIYVPQSNPTPPADEQLTFTKVVSTRKIEHAPETVPPASIKKEMPTENQPSVHSETTTIIESETTSPSEQATSEETLGEEATEVTTAFAPSNDPFENRNGIYTGQYENKPTIHNASITAVWNQKSKDQVNLFALHSTAKVNSYIEIYNPMLNRKVIAKVVGNIPDKAFKKNVELIVSPKVADTLGAKDKKFFVKIRFIE